MMANGNNSIRSKKLNFRDIGGIKTKDGLTVKNLKLLRCAKLNKLSRHDSNVLSSCYRVKYIIDLRSDAEKIDNEDIIPSGAEYLSIPYVKEDSLGITGGQAKELISSAKTAEGMTKLIEKIPEMDVMYSKVVTDDYSLSQLSKCIKLIINNREGSVLYHCTAGKDRTGITTAILLKLLNVDYDLILEDYFKTNEVSGKAAARYSFFVKLMTKDNILSEKIHRVFKADKYYLDTMFKKIDEKFGSFDAFIKDGLKITEEEIQSFRDYILE